MSDMSGLGVIPRLRTALPEMGIIVLTLMGTEPYRRVTLAAGADDLVSKPTMSTELLPAIRRVAQNGQVGKK